jgi:hypothetical protein
LGMVSSFQGAPRERGNSGNLTALGGTVQSLRAPGLFRRRIDRGQRAGRDLAV